MCIRDSCWDNPIAAGSKCRYTERDIRGYLDRYAKDSDITEVWVWYEQTSGNSYEVYICLLYTSRCV